MFTGMKHIVIVQLGCQARPAASTPATCATFLLINQFYADLYNMQGLNEHMACI